MSQGAPALVSRPSTATITINVFDGTRQLYSAGKPLLLTLIDGNQRQVIRKDYDVSSVVFEGLSVSHNAGDNYSALASASAYKDAGYFPVKISSGVNTLVDLMLIPRSNEINFSGATWPLLSTLRPKFKALFSAGVDDDSAAGQRYSDLMDVQDGEVLGCVLNLLTAMDQIQLPQGTPLDYCKQFTWDTTGEFAMAQDRFFVWADPAILDQVKLAKAQGVFADAPFLLHPGATGSYKQIQFGEANVQLTFHENTQTEINGQTCILLEPDIDYYKDPLAHLLLEVAVNAFGSLTDPREVYVLRWIAGRHAGIPEFDPLYTIELA